MIKAFFFDLDGTLVDTHFANYEAYRTALSEFGIEITVENFKQTIGHQARTFLPWLAPGLSDDQYVAISLRKAEYYKRSMHLSVLNTQLIKMIERVRGEHKVVLVTSARRENALAVLSHHGLTDIFDLLITSEDVESPKPSPACYELALEMTGLKPSEVLAFEDSEPGIISAESAGIPLVVIKDFVL